MSKYDMRRLIYENRQLKKEVEELRALRDKPKHYVGYFRDIAALGDIEMLRKAAVCLVSDKEEEISKLKKRICNECRFREV